MKKYALPIIISLLYLLFIGGIVMTHSSSISPYEFLIGKYKDAMPIEKPVQQIYIAEQDNTVLVFYINENGNLSCAVLQKKFFSYRVLQTSAELSTHSQNRSADFLYSSNQRDTRERESVHWGIIYNPLVTKVTINDQEMKMIEAEGLRLCFLLKSGGFPPNSSEDYQLFDAQGNIITNTI